MKKVLIYPMVSSEYNKYLTNLYNTICNEYEIIGYDKALKKGKLFNSEIYHFNWYEGINDKKMIAIRKMFIRILRLLNKKIIWTVHNNFPHDITNKKDIMSFMKFMAEKSDKIHVLNKETINNQYLKNYKEKVICIPHGDYIDNYPKSNIDIYERYNINKENKILLFIGQVRKYKNIELLIKAFTNSNIQKDGFVLLICGNCYDKEYKEELKKFSNENIIFDFNFIKDEEMESYLRNSQMVIAPYNKKSSLNSGTLWMAMSYKKTMMLPLIGCVKDIENYNDMLYIYDYKEESEHYNELLKCFKQLKENVEQNENILQEKGEKCYNYISEKQSWKANKENWVNLYKF